MCLCIYVCSYLTKKGLDSRSSTLASPSVKTTRPAPKAAETIPASPMPAPSSRTFLFCEWRSKECVSLVTCSQDHWEKIMQTHFNTLDAYLPIVCRKLSFHIFCEYYCSLPHRTPSALATILVEFLPTHIRRQVRTLFCAMLDRCCIASRGLRGPCLFDLELSPCPVICTENGLGVWCLGRQVHACMLDSTPTFTVDWF